MRRAAGVLLAGALLTACAFVFDAGPLFVVGPALVLLAVGSAGWVSAAARGAGIERRGLPPRIVEGEGLHAEIELRHGPLGLPGAVVVDALEGDAAAHLRRGLHRVQAPTLVLSDPLGIVSAEIRGDAGPQQLLVLPRTEPIRWAQEGSGQRDVGAGARTRSEPLAAVDIEGLRPYRQGTSASRIHWPALARGAGLLERRLRADGDERPLIVLDARGSGAADPLDAAVRAAASLILALARAGGCRVLLPGERRATVIEPNLANWPSVHARLAVVAGGADAPPPIFRVRAAGAIVYVAARPVRRPPAACTVIVVPGGGRSGLFEVAGCTGFATTARPRRYAAAG